MTPEIDEKTAALIDLAYANGFRAGWNAGVSNDTKLLERISCSLVECVEVINRNKSTSDNAPSEAR